MSNDHETGPAKQMHVRHVGQYLESLSFEVPKADEVLGGNLKDINIKADVGVQTRQISRDLYVSAVIFTAEATAEKGVVYATNLKLSGIIQIMDAPPAALERILHVNYPTLLFPYVRRIIADVTREGGFQPLLLDPYDFAGLLVKKRPESNVAEQASTEPNQA